MYSSPLSIRRSVNQTEAEEALKILNWYFADRPGKRLIQQRRTAYDADGNITSITTDYAITDREGAK